MLQVKLLDSVVSALDFTKTRDAEIAWIDAQLVLNASKKLDLEGEETGLQHSINQSIKLFIVTKSKVEKFTLVKFQNTLKGIVQKQSVYLEYYPSKYKEKK